MPRLRIDSRRNEVSSQRPDRVGALPALPVAQRRSARSPARRSIRGRHGAADSRSRSRRRRQHRRRRAATQKQWIRKRPFMCIAGADGKRAERSSSATGSKMPNEEASHAGRLGPDGHRERQGRRDAGLRTATICADVGCCRAMTSTIRARAKRSCRSDHEHQLPRSTARTISPGRAGGQERQGDHPLRL